ncbi:hypothetical protein [Neobacillus sp. Marseille-QA0830]
MGKIFNNRFILGSFLILLPYLGYTIAMFFGDQIWKWDRLRTQEQILTELTSLLVLLAIAIMFRYKSHRKLMFTSMLIFFVLWIETLTVVLHSGKFNFLEEAYSVIGLIILIAWGITSVIKKIKLTDRMAKECEIWGYSLLFIALIMQFLILNTNDNYNKETFEYRINYQLLQIWNYLNAIDIENHGQPIERHIFDDPNQGDYYENSLEYHEQFDDDFATQIREQEEEAEKDHSGWYYVMVYSVSTILIAIGRFHDISNKGIPPQTVNEALQQQRRNHH